MGMVDYIELFIFAKCSLRFKLLALLSDPNFLSSYKLWDELETYISGSKLFVRYYIRGECREGDNCRFSHDSKDVPVSIT